MKVADVKECLETMRKIYPFKDDGTYMELEHDMKSGRYNRVTVKTTDISGVHIRLSTVALEDRGFDIGENYD